MLAPDPAFPQLDCAFDAAAMGERFARSLKPAPGRRLRVERCRVDRFRYRPRERAVILYELILCEDPGGRRHRHWLADQAMLLQSFPFDRHRPGLASLAAAYTLAALQVAFFYLRNLEPDWEEKAVATLTHAERILEWRVP